MIFGIITKKIWKEAIEMSRSMKKGGRELLSVLLLFALVFIRFTYYGLKYYPQLDDYLHYSIYTPQTITADFLTTRPLASIFDIYVWGSFWGNMIVAVLILSILYTLAIYLLMRVFRQYFSCGWMFLLIAALLPLGFEGLYWISASSRIIVGLFFASLAALMLQCFYERRKWYFALLFALLQLVSFLFYEQIILLSIAITLVQSVLNFRRLRWKTLFGLLCLLNLVIYFVGISFLGDTSRAQLANPFLASYWTEKLPALLRQLYESFVSANFFLLFKGFLRGMKYTLRDGAWLYLIGILALCVVLFVMQYRSSEGKFARRDSETSREKYKPLVGLLLLLAPLTVFFAVSYNWFSLRNAVPSLIGLALLGEWLLEAFFRDFKHRKAILAVFVALFAFVCCFSAVSELHDYSLTNRNDRKIAQEVSAGLQEVQPDQKVGVLHLEASYLETWNYQYHEHLAGCGSSDWALGNVIESITGRKLSCSVTPLPVHPPYYTPEDYEAKKLSNFDQLFLYNFTDGTMTPVTYKENENGDYEVYFTDGRLVFTIWRGPDGCGYVRW